MVRVQCRAQQPVAPHDGDPVAALTTGAGEVPAPVLDLDHRAPVPGLESAALVVALALFHDGEVEESFADHGCGVLLPEREAVPMRGLTKRKPSP